MKLWLIYHLSLQCKSYNKYFHFDAFIKLIIFVKINFNFLKNILRLRLETVHRTFYYVPPT